jgi:hypothetical protein
VGAAAEHLDHRGPVRRNGVRHHARLGRDLLYAEGGGKAATACHENVEQCDVGAETGGLYDRRAGVADGGHAYEIGGVFEELQ